MAPLSAPHPSRAFLFLSSFFLAVPAFSLSIQGDISSNVLWTVSDSPVDVTGPLTIDTGASLTVQPGVTVRFAAGAGLTVQGVLIAQGTAGNPVLFTSYREGSSPAPGDWGSISFQDSSDDAQCLLEHVAVRYGTSLQITNASPTFRHVSFENNADVAVYMVGSSMIQDGQDLSASGNGINGIRVHGSLSGSLTWTVTSVPYVIPQGYMVTLSNGSQLTINPGVVVKLESQNNGSFPFRGNQGSSVNWVGTASDPIVFTSLKDDGVMGDTRPGDGPATPGDWSYILLQGPATNSLDHVVFKYGGLGNTPELFLEGDASQAINSSFSQSAAIGVWLTEAAHLASCDVSSNALTGVRITGTGAAAVESNVIANNGGEGIKQDDPGPAVVKGNQIIGNGGYGTSMTGAAAEVSGNVLDGNGSGTAFVGAGSPIWGGNTFRNTKGQELARITPDVNLQETTPNVYGPNNPVTGVWVNGNVSGSSTWGIRSLPYIIGQGYMVTLSNGSQLTINPGVVVKLESQNNGSFPFRGNQGSSVNWVGTASDPIVFTSLKDDGVMGDTRPGDGPATPGDWSYILLQGPATNSLDHVVFKYGGLGNTPELFLEGDASQAINSSFSQSAAIGVWLTEAAHLASCDVSSNALTGVRITGTGAAAVESNVIANNGGEGIKQDDPGPAVVKGNQIIGNGGYGTSMTGAAAEVSGNVLDGNGSGTAFVGAGSPIWGGNTFRNTKGQELARITPDVNLQETTPNVYGPNNPVTGVWVNGNVSGSSTWGIRSLPYIIGQGYMVTLSNGSQLTINPGVVVKLESQNNGSFPFRGNQGSSVNWVGTASDPIVFTSLKDDGVMGDTRPGDGPATPGDWSYILLQGPATNSLDHVVFKYGGLGNTPELFLEGDASQAINSSFSQSAAIGVWLTEAAHLASCDVSSNALTGVRITGTGAAAVESNVIANNGGEGIKQDDPGPAVVKGNQIIGNGGYGTSMTGAAAEVSGNVLDGNGGGTAFARAGSPIWGGNTFRNTKGQELAVITPDVNLQETTPNVYGPNNLVTGVWVNGGLSGSGTWGIRSLPYIIGQGYQVTLGNGSQLTISPGVVVKLESQNNGSFPFRGNQSSSVNWVGTAAAPIVFTSLKDDSVMGDTRPGDGPASPGDWSYILLQGPATNSLDHVVFKYGGQGNQPELYLEGSASQASDSSFSQSAGHGVWLTDANSLINVEAKFNALSGVRISGQATPTLSSATLSGNSIGLYSDGTGIVEIHDSNIQGNASFGVQNVGSGVINAQNNWWGDPSGPKNALSNPSGLGDQASDKVNFNPWKGSTTVSNPSVAIQEGGLTAGATVHLQLSAGGASTMRVSEAPSLPVAPEPYAVAKTWVLSPGDGPKTIYVQFYAADGSPSPVVSAATNLQGSPPTAAIALSPASPVAAGSVQVTLTASEKLQSVPSLSFTPQGRSPVPVFLTTADFLVFRGTITVTPDTGDGSAVFQFSGVDVSSTTGTAITAGGIFVIDTTPPGRPGLLSAAPLSGGRVHVAWTPPAGEPAAAYNLYRSSQPFSTHQGLTPLQPGLSGLSDDDLPSADGVYYYAVTAKDAVGNEGEISNVLSAQSDRTPPAAPQGLTASRTAARVDLAWTPPTGEPAARYDIYRNDGSPPSKTPGQRIAVSTGAAIQDALTATGEYFYAVSAEDALGNESPLSNVPPVVHYDITPPSVTQAQFSPPAPVGVGVLTVKLIFSEALSTGAAPTVSLAPPTGPALTVASVTFTSAGWVGNILIQQDIPQGQAQLKVSGAADLDGNVMGLQSFPVLVDFTPPAPPQTPAVRFVPETGEAEVSWTAPAGETSLTYNLYRSSAPLAVRAGATPIKTGLTALSTRDIPAADGDAAYYAVTALDAAHNESDLSAPVSIALPFTPVIQSPVDNSLVNAPVVSVSGLAQAGATVGVYSSTGAALGSAVAGPDRRFSVSVMLANGSNLLRATAQNAQGRQSAPSGILTLLLDALPATPAAPVFSAGDTMLSLTWTAVSDADVAGYNIYRDGAAHPLNAAPIPAAGPYLLKDIGLTNGRRYRYSVTAVDIAGQEGLKSPATEAIPQAGPRWGGAQ